MRPITATAALLAALLFAPSNARADAPWAWPVQGEVVTQFRNGTDPYAAGQHRGIDIAAAPGAPVVAAASGTVTFAGTVGSSGLTVAQRTADGRYVLSYLHLSQVAVRAGETVAAGEALGAVGMSGTRSAEQPHLHFGVRESADRHAYVDPLRFLVPPVETPRAPQPPLPVPVPAEAPPVTAPVTGLAADAAAAPAPAVNPHAPPAAGTGPAAHPGSGTGPVAHPRIPPIPGFSRREAPGAHRPTDHRSAAGAATSDPRPRAAAGGRARPVSGPAPSGVAGPEPEPRATATAPAPPREAARPGRGGIDLGWLLACVGLVAAAALLTGQGGGRRARPSARTVFATVLRAGSRG
jgi:hypothetical protein